MSSTYVNMDTTHLSSFEMSILLKNNSTMIQLTKAVESLEKKSNFNIIRYGVSSSVSVELLGLYLRAQGLRNNVIIDVIFGNYDDPIGDVDRFKKTGIEHLVLLPFFDNLLTSFEARIETISSIEIDAKEEEFRQCYRLVFEKSRNMKAIYLGTFHRLGGPCRVGIQDKVELAIARFNKALCEEAAFFKNIHIIDLENVVRQVGHSQAFDFRFYLRNKAPYSCAFMKEISRTFDKASRGFGTYFYKVLALDCDNTIWGGIVGEDMVSDLKLDPHDFPGNIFWRIQHEIVALERQGILLVLLSKNNAHDVDEIFNNHPNMVIKNQQIISKRINWRDKASNLIEIANELNLGLESFIYLDDSGFECESMRKQLPMVKTIQVPSNLSDYPNVINEIKSLFIYSGRTTASNDKTKQYIQVARAESLKAQSSSISEYLDSLELKVEVRINELNSANRISELSQKTNQFNLTNRRYNANEIEQMMIDESHYIYSLTVRDKFGNAGLTGVVVVEYVGDKAVVENFFMSCRILGRGIEDCIWEKLISDAIKRGCKYLKAIFVPSDKNGQVTEFYDRLGLKLQNKDKKGLTKYLISTLQFLPPKCNYIEMIYVD